MPQAAASCTPFGHVDGTYVVVVAVVCVVMVGDEVVVEVVKVTVVLDLVVVVAVEVEVQSSPHITGQFDLAKSPCSPFSTQSDFGIRDPQPADSVMPWHF